MRNEVQKRLHLVALAYVFGKLKALLQRALELDVFVRTGRDSTASPLGR